MLDLFLMFAILLVNVASILIVYKILKKLPKKEILIFIAASVAIIYILVSVVYFLSGIGIDKSVHNSAKSMVTFIFVPVNVIFFIPYLAFQYMKAKEKKIKYLDFSNKITTCFAIFIIVLIIEFFYFRSIQNNIKNIATNANVLNNEVVIENKSDNETENNNSVNIVNNNIVNNSI